MTTNKFLPIHKIVVNGTSFQKITLNKTTKELTEQGVILWCIANAQSDWTMTAPNEFLFEDEQEALKFAILFT